MIKKTYKEKRPWGEFWQYTHNELSTVKILKINPGQKNSLQYHRKRSELWIALDENSKVNIGDKTWKPESFEEIFINVKQEHRLIGGGKKPGYVLEISHGNFDESDIVRVEDAYGRAQSNHKEKVD